MCYLMDLETRFYSFYSAEECDNIVRRAIRDGVVLAIGGATSAKAAEKYGLEHITVENSPLSLLKAIETAEQILKLQKEEAAKQEALKIRLERYNLALNFTHDAVVAVGQEGRIEVMNSMAERLVGTSLESASGKKIDEVIPENAKQDITTFEVFGECLHKYMIKDAIADENVLGFLVEYYQGKLDSNEQSEIRMKTIAEFIVNNFRKSTFDGEFNALFAVQSVPMLLKYYKIFKDLQPNIKIAAIFTYSPNVSQDDAKTGMNQGFETDSVQADELQAIMDDYNTHFGTAFTTDNFGAYYDDINERMKKRKAGMEPIDLLIVVGMFLTGFDAKKLNTLYVDKNLEYHGLLQAFSRTNRILNEKKRFGKILCFRDLKAKVDESLKLFCDGDPNVGVQRPEFKQVKRELNELSESFLQKYPTMESVDALKSEYDKKKFLLAFRDIIKKHAEIQIYEDYIADDPGLILSEQDYNDYRSKYLDLTVGFIKEDNPEEPLLLEEPQAEYGEGGRLEDIDFCLELLHSDVINVAYILSLISNLNPSDEDYEQKRQEILDTMIKDATMRKKTRLIDGFIKANVDYDKEGFKRAKADGTMDLETRLKDYIIEKKTEAVEELASEEGVDAEALGKYMSEYDYLGREKPEIIQEAVRKKKMGLLARSATVRRIVEKMREIFDLFNWE